MNAIGARAISTVNACCSPDALTHRGDIFAACCATNQRCAALRSITRSRTFHCFARFHTCRATTRYRYFLANVDNTNCTAAFRLHGAAFHNGIYTARCCNITTTLAAFSRHFIGATFWTSAQLLRDINAFAALPAILYTNAGCCCAAPPCAIPFFWTLSGGFERAS